MFAKYNNKGQASIEFLTTYGWAFVVLLTMIGSLNYLGFMNTSSFIPDRCIVGGPFVCEEFVVGSDGFLVGLRHNVAEDLMITEFFYFDQQGQKYECEDFKKVYFDINKKALIGCYFNENSTNFKESFGFKYTKQSDQEGLFIKPISGNIVVNEIVETPVVEELIQEEINQLNSKCPEGFIFIPANLYFSTPDFCVMRWEAKAFNSSSEQIIELGGRDKSTHWADNSVVPVSSPQGIPWTQISANNPLYYNSIQACQSQGWRLITNREWMVLARQIEENSKNWLDLVVGSTNTQGGGLIFGNSDGSPPLDGYEPLTGKTRRTFYLKNNDVIWDFSGNTWNWVDFMETGNPLSGNVCGGFGRFGYLEDTQEDSCDFTGQFSQNTALDKRFEIGPFQNYNSEHSAGKIGSSSSSSRFARRGGRWTSGETQHTGIYSLFFQDSVNVGSNSISFRCTTNPAS